MSVIVSPALLVNTAPAMATLYLMDYVMQAISVLKVKNLFGPVRELNPGPPAPEARIIRLDQLANLISTFRS